eukprot:45739-Rhodomonas_salina.2
MGSWALGWGVGVGADGGRRVLACADAQDRRHLLGERDGAAVQSAVRPHDGRALREWASMSDRLVDRRDELSRGRAAASVFRAGIGAAGPGAWVCGLSVHHG